MAERGHRKLKFDQLMEEYPFLEGWFPEQKTAQVHDDRRLFSAEEKIEKLGGAQRVKEAIITGEDPTSALILLACKLSYMVSPEVRRLSEFVGFKLPFVDSTPLPKMLILEQMGELDALRYVTFIQRQENDTYSLRGLPGFQTTSEGIRKFAENTKTSVSVSGVLNPQIG